jgi:hypothetical protein
MANSAFNSVRACWEKLDDIIVIAAMIENETADIDKVFLAPI